MRDKRAGKIERELAKPYLKKQNFYVRNFDHFHPCGLANWNGTEAVDRQTYPCKFYKKE